MPRRWYLSEGSLLKLSLRWTLRKWKRTTKEGLVFHLTTKMQTLLGMLRLTAPPYLVNQIRLRARNPKPSSQKLQKYTLVAKSRPTKFLGVAVACILCRLEPIKTLWIDYSFTPYFYPMPVKVLRDLQATLLSILTPFQMYCHLPVILPLGKRMTFQPIQSLLSQRRM